MGVWFSFAPVRGLLVVAAASEAGLCRLSLNAAESEFLARLRSERPEAAWRRPRNDPVLGEAVRQLRSYFRGELRRFDVPLDLGGTPFQRAVWSALQGIPYGETRSYGDLAAEIGRPRAARAVGQAAGANPVAIIVPCHRLIAAGGSLGGFAWGPGLKRFLLEQERRAAGHGGQGTASRKGRPSRP